MNSPPTARYSTRINTKKDLSLGQRPRANNSAFLKSINSKKNRYRPFGIGTTLSQDAEQALAQWVMDLRRDGIPVSHLLLQIKAKDAAVEAGIPGDKFRASMQWVEGFKRRWNFAMRAITRSGKANEAHGQPQLDSFSTRIQQVIHDHKIVKIFNADRTAVNFEMIPTKTLSKEGLKTVWVMAAGKDKERVSAMLMADADGIKRTCNNAMDLERWYVHISNAFTKTILRVFTPIQLHSGMPTYRCNF
ncbi:hypothetical protein Ae201684P_003576 [Aphanomyces euteiches]|nr:hypothetical protein Ae201684P_003576 [Aphanomyces euteiches]